MARDTADAAHDTDAAPADRQRGKLKASPVRDGPPATETGALLAMLMQAAANPDIDVDRLERLHQIYERAAARAAVAAYEAAFAAMQADMPEIDKRGRLIIRDRSGERIIQSTPYALWEDTSRVIRPVLARYGFGLRFRIEQEPDRIVVTAVLGHKDGHREETSFRSPIDATGSKNNVQAWGSAMSYAKRYAATALLNITTRGEDDDGAAAGGPATITEDQAAIIRDWIARTDSEESAFLLYFGLRTVEDLPADKFDAAIAAFKRKSRQAQ